LVPLREAPKAHPSQLAAGGEQIARADQADPFLYDGAALLDVGVPEQQVSLGFGIAAKIAFQRLESGSSAFRSG
jgi:hypothetical protein